MGGACTSAQEGAGASAPQVWRWTLQPSLRSVWWQQLGRTHLLSGRLLLPDAERVVQPVRSLRILRRKQCGCVKSHRVSAESGTLPNVVYITVDLVVLTLAAHSATLSLDPPFLNVHRPSFLSSERSHRIVRSVPLPRAIGL